MVRKSLTPTLTTVITGLGEYLFDLHCAYFETSILTLCFSACIQYPGFCRDYDLTLTDAVGEEVEWEEEDKLPAALVERIKNRKTDTNNPMQIGWKLEAVDLMDPKLICPATVTVSKF